MESTQDEESKCSGREEEKTKTLSMKVLQLSLHRKEGLTYTKSFKVKRKIWAKDVAVSVDCGGNGQFYFKGTG